MRCPTCEIDNLAESKYCRECGGKLAAEEASASNPMPDAESASEDESGTEAERKRRRVAELMPRAFAFAEKGALVEAIATAEEAAGLLPGSSAAHALLATLYERAGQSEKAIEALKRVAALNPEAPVDGERIERLRRARAASHSNPPTDAAEKSPVAFWAPRVGAALAFALVLASGVAVIDRSSSEPVRGGHIARLPVTETAPGALPLAPSSSLARPTVVVPPPATASTLDPFARKFSPPATPAATERRRRRIEAEAPRRRNLPRADAASPGGGTPPVSVSLPATPSRSESGSPLGGIQPGPPEGERIPAGPPRSSSERSGGTPEKSGGGDGGYIHIEVHPATSGSAGETDTKKAGGDSTTQAQALQSEGRYLDALATYREVLASGEPRGEIYQNVGLCHQRLGDRSAARDAYLRAIEAYRRQAKRGGAPEVASRGIDSCRAALEVLGA